MNDDEFDLLNGMDQASLERSYFMYGGLMEPWFELNGITYMADGPLEDEPLPF